MASDPRAAQRRALKKAVLQLVVGVIALDAVAIGLYYAVGVEQWTSRNRVLFTGGWTMVSLIVVLALLQRVRKVRYAR